MTDIGRNELCKCGSGKKYKKCCLKFNENPVNLWENNYRILKNNINNHEIVGKVLFKLFNIMDRENWEGACHATSAVMHIIFDTIGVKNTLYLGEVRRGDFRFDHSWIEIDGKVYDLAIYMGLNNMKISEPIICSINISNLRRSDIDYGIKSYEGLGSIANFISSICITDYMDNFPLYDDGLWRFVSEILKDIEVNIDINELKDKYSTEKWNVK